MKLIEVENAKLMLVNCRLQALEEMFLRLFPEKKEELSALVVRLITEDAVQRKDCWKKLREET